LSYLAVGLEAEGILSWLAVLAFVQGSYLSRLCTSQGTYFFHQVFLTACKTFLANSFQILKSSFQQNESKTYSYCSTGREAPQKKETETNPVETV